MAELFATVEDVRAAYRLVLGREPDSEGFEHYQGLIGSKLTSTRELLDIFLSSSEFQSNTAGVNSKVDMGGVWVVVDPIDPEFGQAIARQGTWEPHIVQIIRSNLAPGQVFVDVGANVGVMSFNAAQVVGNAGKVIAFEPNETNARLFLAGLFENGFQSFVRLHRLALSDRSDVFALQGGSNTHLVIADRWGRLVQSARGDDFLAAEPAIHFVKLDIEGHEPFALRGLEQTLRRHKPFVLCEFNPRCLRDHLGIPSEEFAEEIFALTGAVRAIESNGESHHVVGPKDLLELWSQKNRQAVATGILPDGMLHFDVFFRADADAPTS